MSLPVTSDQPTYPTGKTAPYDNNSCNEQPTLSNLPQHRLELGPPQRRRVNPESLAARLGPELVAEMEKHITPGSIEMPPFSIRRDIQIKFGIDRHHIYDFFHSRGLRCLNEKAMRNSYLETKSQRPARSIVPPSDFPEPRKRRAAAASSEPTSLKRHHVPRKQKGRQRRLERPPSPVGLGSISPLEASFLLEPELDVDSLRSGMTQESLPSSDASLLMSDINCTGFVGQFSTLNSEEKEAESGLSPFHTVSSLLDLSPSISTSTLSTSSSTSSTFSLALETTDFRPRVLPLSSQERKEHYAWLDAIIGPASGIQESMGTYKAFMKQQREVYYDRLLLTTERSTKVAVSHRAIEEFISWLGGPPASGIPAYESPLSIVTAPQADLRFTRQTASLSASSCCSPRGASLLGHTDMDPCRNSRTQGVVAALSVPQLSSRLPGPIPDWTRHSRRRTFSATVDM